MGVGSGDLGGAREVAGAKVIIFFEVDPAWLEVAEGIGAGNKILDVLVTGIIAWSSVEVVVVSKKKEEERGGKSNFREGQKRSDKGS